MSPEDLRAVDAAVAEKVMGLGEVAEHDDLAPRRQAQTGEVLANMKLRQLLGFGPRRLRMLLWLKNHPELERGRWHLQGQIGNFGETVSLAVFQFENIGAETS